MLQLLHFSQREVPLCGEKEVVTQRSMNQHGRFCCRFAQVATSSKRGKQTQAAIKQSINYIYSPWGQQGANRLSMSRKVSVISTKETNKRNKHAIERISQVMKLE